MTASGPIFVEEWDPGFDPSYQIDPDADPPVVEVRPVEDGGAFRAHPGRRPAAAPRLAFVDGVRRGEAWLHQERPGGDAARGLAGSVAAGAALVPADGGRASFEAVRVERFVLWGGGAGGDLPAVPGGWAWRRESVPGDEPLAPLEALQRRMRELETAVAEELAASGATVVVDGTLSFDLRRASRLAGFAKTHHRRLLPPDHHARVPALAAGERSGLFALGEDRYSCYLRLAPRADLASPWSGIIRLELAAADGLEAAVELADALAGELPRFAGVPHRDPRAPQNLQPIGALESHLRHLLGSPGLARRAVRDAVEALRSGAGTTASGARGATA